MKTKTNLTSACKSIAGRILAASLAVVLTSATAQCQIIDWNSVTLSGGPNVYTFSNSTLGTVTVTYSNEEFDGINSTTFGDTVLQAGNTGDETLQLSWTNPINDFTFEIWDIDGTATGPTREELTVSSPGAAIAPSPNAFWPTGLHATDTWVAGSNLLHGQFGIPDINNLFLNFSTLRFTNPAGITQVDFNWVLNGDPSQTGVFALGDMVQSVPEPSTVCMLAIGCLGFLYRHIRR